MAGHEGLFEIDAKPFEEVRQYLELVAQRWDEALVRLQAFVEKV
jgi:hypothetical protein